MNTAMPIGIDDFAEARRRYYLVDKTAVISQLVQQFWQDDADVYAAVFPRY